MNALERHARKQVLLARIEHARAELRRDVTLLKQSAQPQQLLRSALGVSGAGDAFTTGMAWLRRYRVAASLLGGLAPLLRGGGRWRRWLRIGVVLGAGWLGWRVVRDRARD